MAASAEDLLRNARQQVGLAAKQRGVKRGALAALAITLATFAYVIGSQPISIREDERSTYPNKWLAPKALALMVAIGRLGNHRFSSPEDIDGGGLTEGTGKAKLLQSLLQNTLEQMVLAAAAHAAWAAAMPLAWQGMVPAGTALFVVGCTLFFWGYAGGAPQRAMGFGLTFYPSALMLLAVTLRMLAASVAAMTRP